MNNKVSQLNKIKWTIFLQVTNTSLSIFTSCLEKLVQSVDAKRTEVFYLGHQDPLYVTTFSHFCEKANIDYNYCDDQAQALSIAKGNYIVFLTDHTIVSKNILVRLSYGMENAGPTTAIVSPTSNEIDEELGLTPFNLDAVQVKLAKQPIPYVYTMKLALFCLMVKKEVIKSACNLRELILRVNYDGYTTVSANDTLVYHFPEVIEEEISQDFKYIEAKLGVLYRIKVDDDYGRDVFVKSLTKTLDLNSNIYVLDANSKVKIGIFLREKHPELWSRITKYEKYSRPYDERQDYNDLISWAEADGCNWILSIEHDEVLEDKVTAEYLDRFLNPCNPEIFGYKVNHYHFFDSETLCRIDKPWGKMADVRLARLFPGKRITGNGLVAGMCGYVPSLPDQSVRDTGIRFKNYGYVKSEAREQKREFFDKLSLKNGNNQPLDFSYLTNENGMHRYPWIENNSVSIYTPTKKGGDILWQWLDRNTYFADEILVGNDVYGLDKDDLDLLKSYKAKVIPIMMGDNFAEGRNTIIKEATGDWILQLDIDEFVEDLSALRRILDIPNQDGWMFSISNYQKDGGSILTETIRLFKNKDGVSYWGRLHETIDNHVRKSGWKIGKSPVKMNHFGYTIQSQDDAYNKMQRYLEINMKQIKENPMHGMAYYNLALHFLEDQLVDDGIKMLEIASFLLPSFPLAGLELGKAYIIKANRMVNLSLRNMPDNHPVKQGFSGIQQTLRQIMPKNYVIAPGHCMSFFNIHAEEREWLKDHVISMEKKIEEEKTKMLERRAKGQ